MTDKQGPCVRLSARLIRWPQRCPCCGDKPDSTFTVKRTQTDGAGRRNWRSWDIPCCENCFVHENAHGLGWAFVFTAMGALFATAVVVLFAVLRHQPIVMVLAALPGFCLALCVGLAVHFLVRSRRHRGEHCVPDRFVEYIGWYGTVHEFWFSDEDYAADVRRLNHAKVVG